MKIKKWKKSFSLPNLSGILKLRMDQQFWYERARLEVDDIIDNNFDELSSEGHRQLARVWQYLRDQEVAAIQARIKQTADRRKSVDSVRAMPGTLVASTASR